MNKKLKNVHWRLYIWVADFLFTEHHQTHKWVSDISGAEITDKSLSHAGRLGFVLAATVFSFPLAAFWIRVYDAFTTPSESATVFVLGVGSVIVFPLSSLLVVGIVKGVRSFIRKRPCERCGQWTRYYHDLTRAIPDTFPTESEKYYFCSTDCREAWERENMDYDDQSYYGIQTERDEDHWNALAEKSFRQSDSTEAEGEQ